MTELPDDELDKLFRKSSEELDSNFEPEDWNALKKRLDREDGKTPAGWLRKWWPLAILAFLIPAGLGAYYFLNTDSGRSARKSGTEHIKRESAVTARSADPETAEKLKDKDQKVQPGEMRTGSETNTITKDNGALIENGETGKSSGEVLAPVPNADIARTTDIHKNENSKILPRSRSKAGGVFLESDHSKGKKGNGAFSLKKQKADNSQTAGNGKRNAQLKDPGYQAAYATPAEAEIKPVTAAGIVTEQPNDRLVVSADFLNPVSFHSKGNLTLPAIGKMKQAAGTQMPVQPESTELSPKVAVRFGYSPDLSSVGLKNFSKPGSAVSLLFEYALTRRLYLQTGAVRSVKDYSAKAGEYKLMPYVTQINTPYDVDGVCNMFEIPLNFRYDLVQKVRSRWFAGTGFTSCYIQKEKYTYNYSKYVYGQKKGWEGKTGWYWLSHINASAGYEHRMSKKLSLLAEPYVRIPVKRVGYGKVNLLTTGMLISVRYTPVFR